MRNKITCLDGIRALGWFGVFLAHFRGAFAPDAVWWTDKTPFSLFYAGDKIVCILFVISGLVLSYKYFSKKQYDTIAFDAFKRYFRLMPTILVTELAVVFLMKHHLFFNIPASEVLGSGYFLGIFNTSVPSWSACLRESLITTYFAGTAEYIGPLWTMKYEYLGSLLVLASIAIFRNSKLRWLFYAVFLCLYRSYFNYFIIGMIISEILTNDSLMAKLKRHISVQVFLIIAGFFIVGMTDYPNMGKYTRILFDAGIFMFLIGLISNDIAGKILGNKVLVKGSRISYAAYIVHWPIIETFSCGIFLLLYKSIFVSNAIKILLFIATAVLVVFCSFVMNRYVEPVGSFIADKFRKLAD